MSVNQDQARALLVDIDTLLKTQGALLFARENYNEQLAEAFGVALLDFMRTRGVELRAVVAASLETTPTSPTTCSFQEQVAAWMTQCFRPSLYSDMTERGDRLLEEVLELLQATGYDKARVPTLVDYVFNRPIGEPAQEVGGVMVTLAGFCWIADLDMHTHGDRELARITQPDVMERIRMKQAAKNALHFDTPLPGSACPQPGCAQTDGEPCTFEKCPQRGRQG